MLVAGPHTCRGPASLSPDAEPNARTSGVGFPTPEFDVPEEEMPGSQPEMGRAHLLTCVALLWLAGNGMRMTILAVPPLIPLIHDDFRMSETEIGVLAGLPVALFAAAAIPGSLLIARFGALATAVAGLLI